MAKYSKTYSNYLHRKLHQDTNNGPIFERDWGTLGERHVIESGKRKIYADSNFLFTDNNLPGTKSRNNTQPWSDAYTIEDLSPTVNDDVNNISKLSPSTDIRDYAYYGSALELIRASIENIIKWFPGKAWAVASGVAKFLENEQRYIYMKHVVTDGHHNYAATYTDSSDSYGIYQLRNPFSLDFYRSGVTFTDNDNQLRNLPSSWQSYLVNGAPIKSWNIWIKPYNECDADYTIQYDITFEYDAEVCITVGDEPTQRPTKVTGHIYGLKMEDGILWCTDVPGLVLQPRDELIEDYFNSLDGFDAVLLNRTTMPQYNARLVTPIPMPDNNPGYYYAERAYIWPSDGYCILVDTIGFENYVNDLYNLGNVMDTAWCDNIWRNMTHEAIKNFDWTYTREYIEGDEQDNILGGTRMQHILRIWGRSFDDLKRYIDAISLKNVITYKNTGNIANAELSDKAELRGWEVYSTKDNNNDNIHLSTQFINSLDKLENRWIIPDPNAAEDEETADDYPTHQKWFDTSNPDQVTQNSVDNDFMRKLILNAGGIFRTKSTKQAIEQVLALFGFGEEDFEIEERYYSVVPKRADDIFYHYAPNINPDPGTEYVDLSDEYDTIEEYMAANNYTFDEDSEPHIKINTNTYDLIIYLTYGEFCRNYNANKNIAINYDDDEFSGLPLKTLYIDNDYYIVPYFSQDKIYDGDVQFETNGGWGKSVSTRHEVDEVIDEKFNYMETIPYMEVVQNVEALTTVNAYTVGEKTIYYVMDLSDLTEFVESVPTTTSHFFKLINKNNPQIFASWRNVPLKLEGVSVGEYNDLCNSSVLTIGCNYNDYLLCQYHDSMVLDVIGNNPHVGYAAYDLGNQYYEYVNQPFKYAAEHYGYSNLDDCYTVSGFRFDVTEYTDEKIVTREKGTEHEIYYLPSKVLILRNKMEMCVGTQNMFNTYFYNIILKYLTQVIPSTTIFILKDFEQK